jgi:hypothetical protein
LEQLEELFNIVELTDLFPDSSSFSIPWPEKEAFSQIHSYDNAASFCAWLILDNFLTFKKDGSWFSPDLSYTLNIKYVRCVHEMEGYKTFQFAFSQEWKDGNSYVIGRDDLSCAEYICDSYSGSNFVVSTSQQELPTMLFCSKTLSLIDNDSISDSTRRGIYFNNQDIDDYFRWFSFELAQWNKSLIRDYFLIVYPNSTWY